MFKKKGDNMNNVRKRRLLQEYKRNLVNYFLVGCLFSGLPVNIYLVERSIVNRKTASTSSEYSELKRELIGKHRIRILDNLVFSLEDKVSKSEFNFDISFDDMPPYDGSIESSLAIARYVREKVKDIPNEVKYEYILNHFMLTFPHLFTLNTDHSHLPPLSSPPPTPQISLAINSS